MKEKELNEQLTRLMDITHDLHCSVQVMREAVTVLLGSLPAAQYQAAAASIRGRVDGLLEHADDLEGAQSTRERIALHAHLLLQGMQG